MNYFGVLGASFCLLLCACGKTDLFRPAYAGQQPAYFDIGSVEKTFVVRDAAGKTYASRRQLSLNKINDRSPSFRNTLIKINPGKQAIHVTLEIRESERDLRAIATKKVSFLAVEGETYRKGINEHSWWLENSAGAKVIDVPYSMD